MDSILRAAGMYVALMLLFRIAGRRSLADLTTFDFVLLLIIGEATQQALLGDDFSFTNAMLVIATLIVLDVGLSLAKLNSRSLARFLDGHATLVVDVGRRDAYQHIRRLFDFCIRHILDRYVRWAVVHNCFHVELPESEGRQKSCPTLFRRSLRLECSMRHVLSRISGANQRCYGRCKHA